MLTMNEPRLAWCVFDAITNRFTTRADEIARFTASGYSFEEWLNWEAFSACASIPNVKVAPKPPYSTLGLRCSQDKGDLLVVSDECCVLVEIGLVHDETSSKWRLKLNLDADKLTRRLERTSTLRIVVLASIGSITDSKAWANWLAKVSSWNEPGGEMRIVRLPPNGQMAVRGWAKPPRPPRPMLPELLAQITPDQRFGELDKSGPVGNELI